MLFAEYSTHQWGRADHYSPFAVVAAAAPQGASLAHRWQLTVDPGQRLHLMCTGMDCMAVGRPEGGRKEQALAIESEMAF